MIALPSLLAELVRIPSINPMGRTDIAPDWQHESRMTDYLEQFFRDRNVRVERQAVTSQRHNLLAYYEPATTAPCHIILEAHQDTVPVDGMVIEPFAGFMENGRLYGRGACDVKGGMVAMIGAFLRLCKDRPAGSAAVTLALNIDEEHTFLGVQEFVKRGTKADFAIVAEPTELKIVHAHKGVLRWQLSTEGVACHSSRPTDGVNAIYQMAPIVLALESYAAELAKRIGHKELGAPSLSIGIIDGGHGPNIVPDFCQIHIDQRLLPGENPETTMKELESYLKEQLTHAIPWKIQTELFCPALESRGGDDSIRSLGEAIAAVTGEYHQEAVPYGTDASTLQQSGIPAVVFGPGSIDQAHTKDEWIDLTQLEQASEILYRFACQKS